MKEKVVLLKGDYLTITHLTQLVLDNPRNLQAVKALLKTQIAEAKLSDARAMLSQVFAQKFKQNRVIEFYYELFEALYKNKGYQAINEICDHLLQHKRTARLLGWKGVALRELKRYEEAKGILEEARGLDKNDTCVLTAYGATLYYLEDRVNSKIALLQSYLKLQGRFTLRYLFFLCDLFYQHSEYKEILDICNYVMPHIKEDFRYHYWLAQAYHGLNKDTEAIIQLKIAKELKPSDLNVRDTYIELIISEVKVEEAINILAQYIEEEDCDEFIASNAIMQILEKNTAAPIHDLCEKMLKLFPKNYLIMACYGNALYFADRFAEGEMYLKLALELDPKGLHALLGYAELLKSQDRVKEAVEYYMRYYALDPSHDYVCKTLLQMAEKAGKFHDVLTLLSHSEYVDVRELSFKTIPSFFSSTANVQKIWLPSHGCKFLELAKFKEGTNVHSLIIHPCQCVYQDLVEFMSTNLFVSHWEIDLISSHSKPEINNLNHAIRMNPIILSVKGKAKIYDETHIVLGKRKHAYDQFVHLTRMNFNWPVTFSWRKLYWMSNDLKRLYKQFDITEPYVEYKARMENSIHERFCILLRALLFKVNKAVFAYPAMLSTDIINQISLHFGKQLRFAIIASAGEITSDTPFHI